MKILQLSQKITRKIPKIRHKREQKFEESTTETHVADTLPEVCAFIFNCEENLYFFFMSLRIRGRSL